MTLTRTMVPTTGTTYDVDRFAAIVDRSHGTNHTARVQRLRSASASGNRLASDALAELCEELRSLVDA